MARYRSKDDIDLRWNQIRRRLTLELDVQIKDWREAALNELLSRAWEEFKRSLDQGDVIEAIPEYETWVARALTSAVEVSVASEAD